MVGVPSIRVDSLNFAPPRADGEYVLYWMIAARRPHSNYALSRAIELAREHQVGVIVLEPLRCDYPWASDRLHRFVIQGMIDNREAFADSPVRYYPYVEPTKRAGKGLLEALAARAVAVVTDEFPCFFLPRMMDAAGARIRVQFEQVDNSGLLPLHAPEREFTVAHSFRRWLQKYLRPHLDHPPAEQPLRGLRLPQPKLPAEITKRWAPTDLNTLDLSTLPIDHSVPPAPDRGGWKTARRNLANWLEHGLPRYAESRNDVADPVASGLSPWLHFGHLSSWEILGALAKRENWAPDNMTGATDGKRGWWGMSDNAEAFLDELVTWRELGYQWCHKHPGDYDRYESLPQFALETLRQHVRDSRQYLYTTDQFEAAATHDEIWNAAQRQLVGQGRIHNYLRMLWGKCIMAWSKTPQDALQTMIHLNNKYALDGRDPNSYSGIMWCLGRFDRAWGPERPVFGKVRYMTSASTRRKLNLDAYLARWGG